MSPELTAKLERIKAACGRALKLSDDATPGPWNVDNWETTVQTDDQIICVSTTSNRDNDSPFIASARTFAPAAAQATLTAIENLEPFAIGDTWAESILRTIVSRWPDDL